MTLSHGKRLLLWRHAEAESVEPGQADRERPLTPSGERDAKSVAAALLAEPPGLVLCSPARRTRQTLAAAEKSWSAVPALRVEPGLYLAEPLALVERLSWLEEETLSVLLVGHQPGLGELIDLLVAAGEPSALTAFARGFRPAALAELRLDIPFWREVGAGRAFFTAFTPASDLPGNA